MTAEIVLTMRINSEVLCLFSLRSCGRTLAQNRKAVVDHLHIDTVNMSIHSHVRHVLSPRVRIVATKLVP